MRPESVLRAGQITGDNLSRGTCPEGDNRDTPIGGVSRLSRLRSGEDVPGLSIIDRLELLDGEPGQEWAWDFSPKLGVMTESAVGGLVSTNDTPLLERPKSPRFSRPPIGSTEAVSPVTSITTPRLTLREKKPTMSPINRGAETPVSSAALASKSSSHRSRITNGSAMLAGVDGRSTTARRFRDLVEALTAEQPKPLTEAVRLQIRTAASLQVHVEELTSRMARGEVVSAEEMTRAANGAIRALSSLNRRQPTRRRASGSAVASYLSSRAPAPEAAE